MCCFSAPVKYVAGTQIFARLVDVSTQLLVYQMSFSAARPVAMILPIPLARFAGESDVKFLSFEHDKGFFSKLDAMFPPPATASLNRMAAAPRGRLPVHSVGSFVASVVPSQADFQRVDERFRLPMDFWRKVPAYDEYGFVVFQFDRASAAPHPMAFTFPTRLPGRLFFPTLHVHDGTLQATERFDHQLYLQSRFLSLDFKRVESLGLECSVGTGDLRRTDLFADTGHASGTAATASIAADWLDPLGGVYRLTMVGERPNRDTVITPDPELEARAPIVVADISAPQAAAAPGILPDLLVHSAWSAVSVFLATLTGALGWIIGRRSRRNARRK